jgi:prevent-host-death family protein
VKTVNVHQAKTNLSALLAEVAEKGEAYVICRNGKPVADLVPHVRRSRLSPHPILRRIRVMYDPTEPLGSEEWPQEES